MAQGHACAGRWKHRTEPNGADAQIVAVAEVEVPFRVGGDAVALLLRVDAGLAGRTAVAGEPEVTSSDSRHASLGRDAREAVSVKTVEIAEQPCELGAAGLRKRPDRSRSVDLSDA